VPCTGEILACSVAVALALAANYTAARAPPLERAPLSLNGFIARISAKSAYDYNCRNRLQQASTRPKTKPLDSVHSLIQLKKLVLLKNKASILAVKAKAICSKRVTLKGDVGRAFAFDR